MSLRLTLRSGSLSQWAAAEAAGNGKLRKGEIGVGWIEVGGSITEVVMRIGPNETPTVFSACPVVTRSPLTATGANVKIPVVDVTNKVNAIVTLSGGSFTTVDEDPGTYESETVDGTDLETAPAITALSLLRGGASINPGATISLAHDGVMSDLSLVVTASGTPSPKVRAVIESSTGQVDLVGTAGGGAWTFPISIGASATGLHTITITADSTVEPDAVAIRSFRIERAAAPAPLSIAITSLQIKNDSTNAVLTSSANGSGITLRADVQTSPSATTTSYQWRRGQNDIAGATGQTYQLVAGDDDANVTCEVTVQLVENGETATASAIAGISVGNAEQGWTPLVPSSDSRLIYVATDGNDTAAAAAKAGRGYYLPGDPEIGDDPTNPVGPIAAYASVVEASKRFRGRNWNGTNASGGIALYTWQTGDNRNGYPDWLLFRRGQTFNMPTVPTAWGDRKRTPAALIGNWVQNKNTFSYEGGRASGRSESERAVIGAWGPVSDARPVVDYFGVEGNCRNMALCSIDVPNGMVWDYSTDGDTADNLLIEDIRTRSMGAGNTTSMKNARFRRCVVTGSFSATHHNQGFFLGGTDTLTIEECVFDRNGYKEDPNDATKWTANVVSASTTGALAKGTGVQPSRTYFDRNLYLSSYDSMTVRGNIICRDGGGSSVQMREGGVVERNLFMWNEMALGMSNGQANTARHKGSLVKDNVVLHDDCFLPPGGWGAGLYGGGASDDVAVLDGNIVTHFHRGNNGYASLALAGKPFYSAEWPASQVMLGVAKDNVVYREFGGTGLMVQDNVHDNGVVAAEVTGNVMSTSSQLSLAGNISKPAEFVYSGNKFHSTTPNGLFRWGWENNGNGDWRFTPYTDGTLAQWQAAGYDTDATLTSDFATFKAAVGWTAPERDIISYMQSVDPTYVVDEDVYVDEDSAVKQATRQKLWEVLASITSGGAAMTEAQAKLASRRYHAFITFIQRAKQNRKGAWDSRYTAEAVNNYIREGFGKAPITGPYTATIEDLGNY